MNWQVISGSGSVVSLASMLGLSMISVEEKWTLPVDAVCGVVEDELLVLMEGCIVLEQRVSMVRFLLAL